MAHSVRPLHIVIGVIITSFLCTLSYTSAKEISSKGIKRISAADWERALNEHPELLDVVEVADNGELHPYVHSRNRRTIGRVFDMFRGLFDRIFGGGKKGGGGGGGYGAPKRPQKKPAASYGPPRAPKPAASYGPPQAQRPSNGYGVPGSRPPPPRPGPPRPGPPRPRPPPPPRRPQRPRPQAAPQQGYGGPRPAQPAPGGYGGPPLPSQPSFVGRPPAPAPSNYGVGPAAPSVGGGDIDGYGAPQAPVIGGGDIDGYGSPQAPAIGGADIDGYGAPQAPVVSGGDLDGYGSPQAPLVDSGSIDSYGSPQAGPIGGGGFRGAPLPGIGAPGPSIELSVGAPFPRAPATNDGLPTSASLADSVFRMIPAPNLATGRPPTDVGNNAQGAQDSYDSPQAPAIGSGIAPTASANPFLDTSAPPLSIYGSDQPAGDIIVGTGKAEAPSGESNLVNIGGQFSELDANIDEYGSPVEPAVGPITDIDIPAGAGAILPGVEPRGEPDVDVYGSPLAPVGTSAPVPQDVLKQIEDNLDGIDSVITNDISDDVPEGELVSATEEEDEYDEIEKEVIEDLVDQIKTELDDPTAITDPEEEKFLKEVINTIEYIENDPSGEGSGDILPSATGGGDQETYGGSSDVDDRGNAIDDEPLFDNVRGEVGDPPATGTPGPTIDLGGGFVDLSNGVLSDSSSGQSTPGEINLTGTTTPAASDENEVITEAPEQTDYDNTYDDGLDQAISASTPIPQYEDSYDNVDVSYADIVDDVEKDADVDVTSLGDYNEVLDEDEYVETADEVTDSAVDEEEDEGYNIPIPDNPLDSSLSGNQKKGTA